MTQTRLHYYEEGFRIFFPDLEAAQAAVVEVDGVGLASDGNSPCELWIVEEKGGDEADEGVFLDAMKQCILPPASFRYLGVCRGRVKLDSLPVVPPLREATSQFLETLKPDLPTHDAALVDAIAGELANLLKARFLMCANEPLDVIDTSLEALREGEDVPGVISARLELLKDMLEARRKWECERELLSSLKGGVSRLKALAPKFSELREFRREILGWRGTFDRFVLIVGMIHHTYSLMRGDVLSIPGAIKEFYEECRGDLAKITIIHSDHPDSRRAGELLYRRLSELCLPHLEKRMARYEQRDAQDYVVSVVREVVEASRSPCVIFVLEVRKDVIVDLWRDVLRDGGIPVYALAFRISVGGPGDLELKPVAEVVRVN